MVTLHVHLGILRLLIRTMMLNITFNNISASGGQFIDGGNRSTRRKPRPAASHQQTLSHNVVSSTPCHERDSKSQL